LGEVSGSEVKPTGPDVLQDASRSRELAGAGVIAWYSIKRLGIKNLYFFFCITNLNSSNKDFFFATSV
jgi:hypothetical protein